METGDEHLRCSLSYQDGKLSGTLVRNVVGGQHLQEVVGPDCLETRYFSNERIWWWRNLRYGILHGVYGHWHPIGAGPWPGM